MRGKGKRVENIKEGQDHDAIIQELRPDPIYWTPSSCTQERLLMDNHKGIAHISIASRQRKTCYVLTMFDGLRNIVIHSTNLGW